MSSANKQEHYLILTNMSIVLRQTRPKCTFDNSFANTLPKSTLNGKGQLNIYYAGKGLPNPTEEHECRFVILDLES
jgi:Golgi nucleoside diphosphatase